MYFRFAWRYFKAPKSTNTINIIAWVTVSAIAVGAMALVVVLSVFNGFESLVRSLYSSFYTDIKIVPVAGRFIRLSDARAQQIKAINGVKGLSFVVEEKAHMQNGDFRANVILKGVDSNYSLLSGIPSYIIRGKFALGNAGTPGAVFGSGIENALGLLSDRAIVPVTVYLPKRGTEAGTSLAASISIGNLNPTGTFAIQQDFDNKYVLTNIAYLKEMIGLNADEYSAVEINLKDPTMEKQVIADLGEKLGSNYKVLTRYEQNKSLYSVMRMEKWVIYGILSLILIIASFNMIGALTMLVLEKEKDIQILQAMGGRRAFIQKIFLSEGILLALVGALLGIILALILCWLQLQFKLIPLGGSSFVIDYYPVKVLPSDILLVMATIFIIAISASWIPSRKAVGQVLNLRT